MKGKRYGGLSWIVPLVVMMLAGCQQPGSLSSDASVTSITVAGIPATLGTPSSNWKEAEAGTVTISNSLALNAAVGVTKSDGGAYVYYAVAEGTAQPNFVENPVLSFSNGNFLYLEVFSANQDAVLFYKVAVTVVDDTPVLFDVQLGGRSASGYSATSASVQKFGAGIGTPAATYDTAIAGEVWFGSSQAGTAIAVSATPMLPSITNLRYAVASGSAAPAFTSDATVTVADGDYLYVEASLTTTTDSVLIYKLKMVEKSDDRSLSSVTINGQAMTIGAMGTHSFPGEEYYGSYRNGAQLATTGNKGLYEVDDESGLASITIAAVPADPALTIRYDIASLDSGLKDYYVFNHSPRTDNATGTFTNLSHGQYLAIQVTSEIGEAGWYAFRVAVGQSGADITGVTIDGVPVTSIGSAVTPSYGFLSGSLGSATIATPTAATTVAAALASNSDEATVEYGVSSSTSFWGMTFVNVPSTWNTTGVFEAGSISTTNCNIVIRVTSENSLNQSYYVIKLTLN